MGILVYEEIHLSITTPHDILVPPLCPLDLCACTLFTFATSPLIPARNIDGAHPLPTNPAPVRLIQALRYK